MNSIPIFLTLYMTKMFWFVVLYITSIQVEAKSEEKVIIAEEEWDPAQMMCPGISDSILTQFHIPWGVPGRAYLTVPPEVEVVRSKIPGAGLGVVSKTFIRKHTWLGDYEGITIIPEEEDYISNYAWISYRGAEVGRFIDGGVLETSNWLRFINTPKNLFDENVIARHCLDRVHYQAFRDIVPGEELLVYYGKDYTKSLSIWEEYNFSLILNHVGKTINTRKDLKEIFTKLKGLLLPLKGRKVAKILSENKDSLVQLMGNELYTALITHKYITG